jgi:enamine deaminase RidA (YjgF/YER057c/UK114 family)
MAAVGAARVTVHHRLSARGLVVPEAPRGVASYESWMRHGALISTSFQLPWKDGQLGYVGRVAEDVSVSDAYRCAQLCALNVIAQLEQASGDLELVRLVRVEGHVGCGADFDGVELVLDGASDLFRDVFAERGRHARTANAHAVMPLNVPVMVAVWAEITHQEER